MSLKFVTVIAKTHNHADRFAQEIYPTLNSVPIRLSIESAKENLRGARSRVIYLVDLDLPEISFFKSMHESRNLIFVVYWKEPVP